VAVAPLRSQGTVAADVAGVSWRRAFEKGGLERGSWLSGHDRARRFLGAVVVWSERVAVRDGVRLVCRDRGRPGEPVVLLHGLAGHAGEWGVVASRLIARYRVVAVDQRGHGASERHPCARTSTSTCSNSPAASSA